MPFSSSIGMYDDLKIHPKFLGQHWTYVQMSFASFRWMNGSRQGLNYCSVQLLTNLITCCEPRKDWIRTPDAGHYKPSTTAEGKHHWANVKKLGGRWSKFPMSLSNGFKEIFCFRQLASSWAWNIIWRDVTSPQEYTFWSWDTWDLLDYNARVYVLTRLKAQVSPVLSWEFCSFVPWGSCCFHGLSYCGWVFKIMNDARAVFLQYSDKIAVAQTWIINIAETWKR